ncbi:hypothetical protein ACOMHN_062662 [Nucella lapillus]
MAAVREGQGRGESYRRYGCGTRRILARFNSSVPKSNSLGGKHTLPRNQTTPESGRGGEPRTFGVPSRVSDPSTPRRAPDDVVRQGTRPDCPDHSWASDTPGGGDTAPTSQSIDDVP